jgi:hypothetical protein
MDRYGVSPQQFAMHHHRQQQQNMPLAPVSYPHQFSAYPSASEWTGIPLIKSVDSPAAAARHKKAFNTNNHSSVNGVNSSSSLGYEFDDCGNIARMAKHAHHGSPIIVSGRFRKPQQPPINAFNNINVNGENGNVVRNQNACNSSTIMTASSCETGETHIAFDESGYHANGTCLPRIIKPRKRRKKDRKPLQQQQQQTTAAAVEKVSSPNPFTFSSANDFMQNRGELKISNNGRRTDTLPPPPTHQQLQQQQQQYDSNLFFNNDFNANLMSASHHHHIGSTSSSPISLSNSSLSSSTGGGTSSSSCSCRLCDPNCKIWAFPLRRSFSDNAAVEIELEHHLNSIDSMSSISKKKDVGVIGGNRVKAESNLCTNSSFAIMDLIEFNHNRNPQHLMAAATSRLRSESSEDSADSGCELLLSGLNISNDAFAIDSLNTITQQLSNFNLMVDDNSRSSSSFNDNSEQLNYMNANNKLSSINQHANNNDSMCTFSDHHHHQQQLQHLETKKLSDFDKLFAMNLTPSCSDHRNNYSSSSGGLMSPMLVNKQQTFSIIDVNNNNKTNHSVNNSNFNNAQSLCVNLLDEDDLNERSSSFQFDIPWK